MALCSPSLRTHTTLGTLALTRAAAPAAKVAFASTKPDEIEVAPLATIESMATYTRVRLCTRPVSRCAADENVTTPARDPGAVKST